MPTIATQSVIAPAHFAEIEGDSYAAVGTINSAPHRVLQVHDDLKGTARSIGSVAFRRDWGHLANQAAYSILCDVFASTAKTTGTTISATFDNNHGADRTQVAATRLVAFPATVRSGPPAPFDYKVLFAQPFAFGGASGLCIEVRTTSNTSSGGLSLDGTAGASQGPQPYLFPGGSGCKATGFSVPAALSLAASANWQARTLGLNYSGTALPPNGLATVCIGVSNTTWGALPLPYELPTTATAPSTKCTIYNDWLLTVLGLTNSAGNLAQSLSGLPLSTSWHGLNIYSQLVALDTAANAWGFITTNTVRMQFLAPYAAKAGWVYVSGNLGATGTAYAGSCLIAKFE